MQAVSVNSTVWPENTRSPQLQKGNRDSVIVMAASKLLGHPYSQFAQRGSGLVRPVRVMETERRRRSALSTSMKRMMISGRRREHRDSSKVNIM